MDVKQELDAKPCGNQEEKAEELHEHTFTWQYNKLIDPYTWTCTQAGTIYEALQKSDEFQEIASKNRDKELVILTPKKAISSHFPCHQITFLDIEHLIIKYIKAKDNQTTTKSSDKEKLNPGEIVTFTMSTAGDKKIKHLVMKNTELKTVAVDVIVYGYKGQTVREALEQDGRFSDEVFERNCVLEDVVNVGSTGMAANIAHLNGKHYKFSGPKPKKRKLNSDAKRDALQKAKSNKTASSKMPPQEQNVSKQPTQKISQLLTQKMSQLPTPAAPYVSIPNTEELLQLLRSQFEGLVEHMKNRQNTTSQDVQQLFAEEYGKNVETCFEVKTMKKVIELGESVCQVRIEGNAAGSGFLLFGKYILTNAHVILEGATVRQNITVIFFYEDLAVNKSMAVKYVDHEYKCDDLDHKHDWALLEVYDDDDVKTLPQPLLKHIGLVKDCAICIIGHPDGQVKKIDPCVTIPCNDRKLHFLQYGTKHLQFPKLMDPQLHTYTTCFYDGSSGSPVINRNGQVVAMHTGAFNSNDKGNVKHVIEYAHPLLIITEQIISQMIQKKREDVLSALRSCNFPNMVMDGIKEIEQPYLKVLFDFFSQRDTPMETD